MVVRGWYLSLSIALKPNEWTDHCVQGLKGSRGSTGLQGHPGLTGFHGLTGEPGLPGQGL